MTEMVIQQLLLDARRGRHRPGAGDGRAAGPRGGRRLADAAVARDVRRLPPEHRLRAGRCRSASTSRTPTPRPPGCRSTTGRSRGLDRGRGTPRCSNEPGGADRVPVPRPRPQPRHGTGVQGSLDPVPGLPRWPARGRRARERCRRRRQRDRHRPAHLSADPPTGRRSSTAASRSSSSTPASRRTASRSADAPRPRVRGGSTWELFRASRSASSSPRGVGRRHASGVSCPHAGRAGNGGCPLGSGQIRDPLAAIHGPIVVTAMLAAFALVSVTTGSDDLGAVAGGSP